MAVGFLYTLLMLAALFAAGKHNEIQSLAPNIIVILIDDLDWNLGGMDPMVISRRLFDQRGYTFNNAFVTTPVCCPSRSSILTGKYVHNHKTVNNTVSGNCSSHHWQNGPERETMATYLQSSGYTTFYGGKYLNQYGKDDAGGVKHVPPGYDRWIGLVGNARYYNYTLSVDGVPRTHGDDYRLDYLTDVLARESLSFIKEALENATTTASNRKPFFAMIAPPACHSPFTSAPQFSSKFADRSVPRWPNFNRHPGNAKHWLLRQAPVGPLPPYIIDRIDNVFRQRWRTLLSVDQMVGRIVKLLHKKNQFDQTCIIMTSDHGFHMGQFAMPIDKRLPYETDIRVPLLIKPARDGSGVCGAGSSNGSEHGLDRRTVEPLAVVSVDLAPTVLDVAGLAVPNDMDGVSLLPLLEVVRNNRSFCAIKQGKTFSDDRRALRQPSKELWRTSFLVEYFGEADLDDVDPQCRQDANTTLCINDYGCKCQDATNNTYSCLRTLSDQEDSLYCHFDDEEAFVELYDLRSDPYQLENKAIVQSNDGADQPSKLKTLRSRRRARLMATFSNCRGSARCFHHVGGSSAADLNHL